MFTVEERERLRDALVERARADPRIIGAAVTGSGALDATDAWSDIDLAFGLAADADRDRTMADWTSVMYDEHGTVDHTELTSGSTVFRVFLL
jgi:hypothetical protein